MKLVTEQALLNKQGEDIVAELRNRGVLDEVEHQSTLEELN